MIVYEIKQFTDAEGKLVTATIPVDSITLKPCNALSVKFFGTYTIPHPQMGGIEMRFEFPEGWTVDQCLEKFKEKANEHFAKLQEDAKKDKGPKLWTPGGDTGTGKGKGLFIPKG